MFFNNWATLGDECIKLKWRACFGKCEEEKVKKDENKQSSKIYLMPSKFSVCSAAGLRDGTSHSSRTFVFFRNTQTNAVVEYFLSKRTKLQSCVCGGRCHIVRLLLQEPSSLRHLSLSSKSSVTHPTSSPLFHLDLHTHTHWTWFTVMFGLHGSRMFLLFLLLLMLWEHFIIFLTFITFLSVTSCKMCIYEHMKSWFWNTNLI